MLQSDVPHFQEAGRVNPVNASDYMPESVYSTALDYLVFACVDIVFTQQRQVLLVKRTRKPRQSWWIVGGRIIAGEQPKTAVCRQVYKETNLTNLDYSRLRYVGVYSTCFAHRHQEPKHHGSHSLNLTYQIELTPTEKHQLTLKSGEQNDWRWVTLNQLMSLINANDCLDNALLQIIQDTLGTQVSE